MSHVGLLKKKDKKMKEEQLRELVNLLSKTHSPSQIGHILRDEHNVSVPKLTHHFEELDEDKSFLERLTLKIRFMQLHLKDNRKDYATERSLVRLKMVQKKLISKIKKK